MFSKLFRAFSSKDYYKILGLSKTASKSDIRAAYLKLAKQYHPDSKTGDEEKFKEIGEAWSILGNESSKSAYDSAGSSDFPGTGFNYGNPNYTRSGYYRKNDNEKWQEFYRQQYESRSKDPFQKEFDSFFEQNTKNSQSKQKKKTTYYEFYDPRTGRKYFYSFTSNESNNPEDEYRKKQAYDNFFDQRKQNFMNKNEEEEMKFMRSYSIASMIFAFLLTYTFMSRIMFPKQPYNDYRNGYQDNYPNTPKRKVWDDFEDELESRFSRRRD